MKEIFKKLLNFQFEIFFLDFSKLKKIIIGDKKKEFKVIDIQPTPNPNAYRFELNQIAIESGSKNFASQEEALSDPFSKAVFNLYGIENVFIKDNFITITKSSVVGWGALTGMVKKVIETSLCFYLKPSYKGSDFLEGLSKADDFSRESFVNLSDFEKEKIVNFIFDQGVRPTLAKDGGDLTLIEVRGEVIRIRYEGACGTCPSASQGTLKFIEEMIQENLHPNLKIICL